MKYLQSLFIIFILAGCNKQIASGPDGSNDYKQKVYVELSIPKVEFFENETKDYVLATYVGEGAVPDTQPLQYIVLKIGENTVIKKGVLPNGSVKWIGNYIIEIIAPPGMPEGNKTRADYTSKFDVKSGQSVSKVKMKK
jgi:hypothetical protein